MITLKASSIKKAWEESFKELYERKNPSSEKKILFEDILVLTITNQDTEKFSENFPMSEETLKKYNQFILDGKLTKDILEEHQMYFEKIYSFAEKNNQVNYVINTLKENPSSKRAMISLWEPIKDQDKDKVPCIMYLWFRIQDAQLVMHVHMRANDAYKKLLMNLNICHQIQKKIASELSTEIGEYVHFVDSFHIYKEDEKNIAILYEKLKNERV